MAIALPAADADGVRAVVEGFASGLYRFDTFRSGTGSKDRVADVVVLTEGARRADVTAALDEAVLLDEVTSQVRDWVNTPANALPPLTFAARTGPPHRRPVRGTRSRR